MKKRLVSIVQLFQNDENFRDLCSDYILCTSMVLERKKALNNSIDDIGEFEELQLELEKEILKEILKE